jgi:hypothetical protein
LWLCRESLKGGHPPIAQNIADSHLKREATEKGTKQVRAALEEQHSRYINDLREQFEGKNGVVPKINAETEQLKSAEGRIVALSNGIALTAKKSLDQITGNGQFCYLMATLPVGSQNGKAYFQLAKMNSGSLPLDVCHVLIHDNSPIHSGADAQRAIAVMVDEQLGPLPPGKTAGKSGTQGFGTNIVLPEGSYYIQINTRNDRFYETLTIHPNVPGKGLESIEVRDDQWKIVYSEQ